MALKALVDMSLRKSKDPKDPAYEEWHEWKKGDVFDPPAHMDARRAIERGIAEEVKGKKVTDG